MSPVKSLPALQLLLNGQPLHDQYAQALSSVEVLQCANQPSYCELLFNGLFGKSIESITLGAQMTISLPGENRILFQGDVTACRHTYAETGQESVLVRCYDVLHRLRKTQQLRQFDTTSLSQVTQNVVDTLGVDVAFQAADVEVMQLMQWCESDLGFLALSLQRFGLHFYLRDNTLHVFSCNSGHSNQVTVTKEQIQTLNWELNAEPACRAVDVYAWSPQRAESYQVAARADDLIESTGSTGNTENLTEPCSVNVSGERVMTAQANADENEAEQMGQAMLQRRMAGEVIVTAIMRGNTALCPGIALTFDVSALDKNYTLFQVRHCFDRTKGYVCELDTAPPAMLRVPRIASAMGVVFDVSDPDSMGRIKVRYPALGLLESQWLEIVHAAAGPSKGVIALPDIDDKVLVLFVNGDPVNGVVLGGLYGDTELPDFGIENGRVKRYTFVTPDGQKLILDDNNELVKLACSDGSFVEMSPKKTRIFSNRDMTIEAPGRAMVISANTIDFVHSG